MTFRLSGKSCKNNLIFCGRPFYITLPEGSWHFILLTYLRALLNFSYVILSFFFLCPHIFARASDLTTRKIPCSLSSHSRMPQFSSGDRSRSRTNSHRWELCRPLRRKKSYLFFFFNCKRKFVQFVINPWALLLCGVTSRSCDGVLYLGPYRTVKHLSLVKQLQNTHTGTLNLHRSATLAHGLSLLYGIMD